MKELNINGYKELIVERSDYPIEQCKEILNNKTTAILGYGPQGRGCLLYTSPSPRDRTRSRMPSSA